MTSTQFLQVPKPLPHRRSRSRSRTRPLEVVPVDEVCRFPSRDRQRFNSTPPLKQIISAVEPVQAQQYKWLASSESRTTEFRLDRPRSPYDTPAIPTNRLSPVLPPSPPIDLNGEMYTLEDSFTLSPEPSLRSKIIGAWKLESYIAYPTAESTIQRPTYPMTKNVTGFIMYTPDGYMSAQMLIPGQQSFKRGEGEEPQWAEAGKRCFAYCGPYYITDEGTGREEVLRHTFQVCNLPGWIGDVQVRTHRFEEDGQVLVLGSEDPTEIKGDKRIPVLKWRRARDNSNGVPPPPMPSIRISSPEP